MSVLERAIRKIQGAAAVDRRAAVQAPIARTVTQPIAEETQRAPASPTVRFNGGASGRQIKFDLVALAAAGLLAPENERLADEYRAIKQPILRKLKDPAADGGVTNRLVMVASALPGEGKTFTSVNLSLSLAQERDWSVLLVDTDCRNPSLSRLLGVAEERGLLDFLRSSSEELTSFVLPTNIERLYILPVGRADPHAAELLASERMRAACSSIAKGEFGPFVTVFDSSPLLLTPEPVVINRQVGQVVMVVQADQTTRPAVAEAINKLDTTRAIGLVLNRASSRDALTSYSYGYPQASYPKVGRV
jgi:protein-tyrosine kinase